MDEEVVVVLDGHGAYSSAAFSPRRRKNDSVLLVHGDEEVEIGSRSTKMHAC